MTVLPFLLGAAMGVVMIGMLHRPIMSGDFDGTMTLAAFVGAHLAVLMAVGLLFLAVPALRQRIIRHRPSLRHAALMLGGAVAAAATIHFGIHGIAT